MISRGKARALLAVCVAIALPAVVPGVADAWPSCAERTDSPIPGVSLAARQTAGRVVTLTLNSRAMGDQQTVNVLLPQNYKKSGRRYPVLYLLHGAGGDNRTYLDEYPLEALVGNMPVIVVMPDGSGPDASGVKRNGGYSDWFGVAAGQPGPAFAWETYHLRELVPFIDRTFPTVPGAAGRAIAGISMGGGGAMKYAAAYPGTFGYAGSFSGEIYPELPEAVAFQTPNCKLGDPATEEVVWRDNDPTNLAGNLRGVRLFVRSGDGTPGPYDSPDDPFGQVRLLIEYGAGLMARAFLSATDRLGIPVDAEIYPGSHSQPYWQREMGEFFPWLRTQFAHPVKVRRSFSVQSARPRFTAWDWTFQVKRRVREFLYVHVAKGRRVRLTGSGRVLLRSAEIFKPREQYAVRVGEKVLLRRADRHGRLRLRVSLGPSHTQQQTSFTPDAIAGWKSIQMRIARATRSG
jgi:diacylglycerol O-acyltransferase/trehalose O-mycolyltransferase